MAQEMPSIDIVIPMSGTWRMPYLRLCLSSIKAQEYPQKLLRVIIVHVSRPDGDNDVANLADLCRDFGASIAFCSQEDPSFNISKAYNLGARSGSRDVVACLDGDVLFHPKTLRYASSPLVNGRCAVVPVVRTELRPQSKELAGDYVNRWPDLVRGMNWAPDHNGNALFPRKEFEQIHGYDERYYGWGGADNDIVSRFSRSFGRVDLLRKGCQKSIHMKHKQRKSVESVYTHRNRRILSTPQGDVRNGRCWGGVIAHGGCAVKG